MRRTKARNGWVIVALVALMAVVGLAVGCADSGTSDGTTTSTTADTVSTTTTAAGSTTESTGVPAGKTRADYEAELPDLTQAVEADPTDLYALEALAIAHYQLGQYEEAATAYKKMLAMTDDAFTHNNLGNVYRDWEKSDEAIAEYETAIALDPTLTFPYVNLARVYRTAGDMEKAMEVLNRGAEAINSVEGRSTLDKAKEQLTTTTTT